MTLTSQHGEPSAVVGESMRVHESCLPMHLFPMHLTFIRSLHLVEWNPRWWTSLDKDQVALVQALPPNCESACPEMPSRYPACRCWCENLLTGQTFIKTIMRVDPIAIHCRANATALGTSRVSDRHTHEAHHPFRRTCGSCACTGYYSAYHCVVCDAHQVCTSCLNP